MTKKNKVYFYNKKFKKIYCHIHHNVILRKE